MPDRKDSDSRKLRRRLRDTLAGPGGGQARLDCITEHITESLGTQVCSIYLFRDPDTLELCATKGLRAESVHKTRLRLGEGLVGRVARTGQPMMLVDGLGWIWDRWAIVNVDETKTVLMADGAPRQIDFRVLLRAYGEDRG